MRLAPDAADWSKENLRKEEEEKEEEASELGELREERREGDFKDSPLRMEEAEESST